MSSAAKGRGAVVIVTGASSGIGAAAAEACGARGMRVVLGARREELLRGVAERVERAGGEALVHPMDIRSAEQIERLVAAAMERFGRVDALIANAGLGHSGPVARITDAQITEMVEVNLLGVLRCARAVLPPMIAQRSGHIITVSSVASGLASPRAAVYAATKAGVHRFCEGLRREVERHGIRVTDVLPGVIETAMTEKMRGVPKAPVGPVGTAIAAVIGTRRRVLITPAWYRLVLGANRWTPWLVDALLADHLRRYGAEGER